MSRISARGSIRWGAVAGVVLTVLGACGSQIPPDELSAAHLGAGSSADEPARSRPTATSVVEADDPAAAPDDDPAAAPDDDGTGVAVVSRGGGQDVAVAGDPTTPSVAGAAPAVDDAGVANGPSCTGEEEPITFGAVGSQSGVLGVLLAVVPKTVQAWAESVNAAGGLNCHEVRYIIADDNNDPARHQTLVRQLVEDQGVIAFVGMNSGLVGGAAIDYLEERGVPVVGMSGAEAWAYDSPMFFPQVPSSKWLVQKAIAASGTGGARNGLTRLGMVVCVESSLCTEAPNMAEASLAGTGVELVYSGQATLTQPDYSAVCTAASRANAEVLLVILDGGSMKRLARSCASVSYEPRYAMQAAGATPDLFADPNFEGMFLGSGVRPWTETNVPTIARLERVLEQFAPHIEPQTAATNGWAAAMLLEAAVGDSTEITSRSILEGLWAIEDKELGGLTGPVAFTRGERAEPTICYWVQEVVGRSVVTDGERTCVDPLPR